jgi:hypothetical protein
MAPIGEGTPTYFHLHLSPQAAPAGINVADRGQFARDSDRLARNAAVPARSNPPRAEYSNVILDPKARRVFLLRSDVTRRAAAPLPHHPCG